MSFSVKMMPECAKVIWLIISPWFGILLSTYSGTRFLQKRVFALNASRLLGMMIISLTCFLLSLKMRLP